MDLNHRQTNGSETRVNPPATSVARLPEHVDALNELLADWMVFHQKLRGFRWTVTGPRFFELRTKFEELFQHGDRVVDDLGERVVALGGRPVGSLMRALGTTALEENSSPLTARQMVETVAADITSLLGTLRAVAAQAEHGGDKATCNTLETHADDFEKSLWMLRAWLA
jgi:starvation-inducible DNA-binding protein